MMMIVLDDDGDDHFSGTFYTMANRLYLLNWWAVIINFKE